MDSVNTLLVGSVTTFLANFSHLQQLAAVNTLIIPTAECELSLSTMSTTISCVRSSMFLKRAAALMFISPISEFNPENYAKE
jgi:hypothetical protein